MKASVTRWMMTVTLLGWVPQGAADIKVVVEHRASDEASAAFLFKNVPAVRRVDAGAHAVMSIVDGQADQNSGGLGKLNDGQLPNEEDQPSANFFFRAGSDGGRILVDLGKSVDLKQVNTYSWHAGSRGPQVYTLYRATDAATNFTREPKRGVDPLKCGWALVASVDTRTVAEEGGGQHGVSIQDPEGTLGAGRYLLFDMHRTEQADPFGNTFYSEIDVVDNTAAEESAASEPPPQISEEVVEAGEYTISIDTTETPDLTDWVRKEVGPMASEWYPKLVALFPSDGFSAPRKVRISFSKDMRGVAATSGTRIRCAAGWFRGNLQGEALGAVFHELVHVVQQYGGSKPLAAGASRPPGWLVEGIADYTRWFKFEPRSRGAEITSRNIARARYDGNYRITANFLNWASETYDKDLVPQLNAAIREGRYSEKLWSERSGHTLQEAGAAWKTAMEKKVAAEAGTPAP